MTKRGRRTTKGGRRWAQRARKARTLRSPAELAATGLARPETLPALEAVAARYAVAITPDMAELIDPADPADPIARQFVPHAAELETRPEELADPIGDGVHEVTPGLVHRYPDRVLLKFTGLCAVYCRFCFRREAVGQEGAGVLSESDLAAALAYIGAHREIWEVIVSGGDPLVASPRRIASLMARLASISHVKIVRFHTRVPVVAPERISDDLIGALKAPGATTWVAIHANHERELTPSARAAIARLANAGIPLVSQTVLLAGINDDPAILGGLMRAFVENRVKPYYLHHGDLAPGTGRFRTSIGQGQAVMHELRRNYSGLCQPTYVLDIPGGHGKVPVGPVYLDRDTVTDPSGLPHRYGSTGPRG
ncbi:MAG TPA: lysine-2,3-aminomutase-like protein [Bauldia sp.]|nr:lysine-2,3-aminomutase-like protein [Bauldia sp.]